MVAKSRTRRTPEERREAADAIHKTLEDQVLRLTTAEGWMKYLHFRRRFTNYSINNQLLIMAQCPEAVHVATYRKWQEMGRQVRKGSQSIKIYGPPAVKKTGEFERDPQTGIEKEKLIRTAPKIYSVFDYADTDPVEGATKVFEPADIPHPTLLEGEDESDVYTMLSEWLTEDGWDVGEEDLKGSLNGYTRWDKRMVRVAADRSPRQKAKTMIHECAHVLLEHGKDDPMDYVQHRGFMETQAESVAYVVAGLFDMDTSAYSVTYIANWSGDDVWAVRDAAGAVLEAVNKLVEVLEAPDEDQVPADAGRADAGLAPAGT